MGTYIRIKGARENNLKNVNIDIPHGLFTVLAGVSGSGKSSLVYDVIFAEGQRLLLDCISQQARKFTKQLKPPRVDMIKGLTPVVCLQQFKSHPNPHSTIGTLTDVGLYLRFLFSVMGGVICPFCGERYPVKTINQLVQRLKLLPEGTHIEIHYPLWKPGNKTYSQIFDDVRNKGYKKIYINGEKKDLRDWIKIDEDQAYDIFVISDSFTIKPEFTQSEIESIEQTVHNGERFIRIHITDENLRPEFSSLFMGHGCPQHGLFTCNILPFYFSFNDLDSACEVCRGSGVLKQAMPFLMVKNKKKSLREGPFFPTVCNLTNPYKYILLYSLSRHYGFNFDEPFINLPDHIKDIIFYGTGTEKIKLVRPDGYEKNYNPFLPKHAHIGQEIIYKGIVNEINDYYKKRIGKVLLNGMEEKVINNFMIDRVCPECSGTRLKKQRKCIIVNNKTFTELCNLELIDLQDFFEHFNIDESHKEKSRPIIREITSRLKTLIDIGVGYLTLSRRTDTLSGGEYQRVQLARQIGSGLIGITYVIDEPTIGLHAKDTRKIVSILKRLKNLGNTVITIEHDLDVIKNADNIIEMGPGAGVHGGTVIASGSVSKIKANPRSILSRYMNGTAFVPSSKRRSGENRKIITIKGARENNLKDIDVSIPLHSFVCITGVSGSGKTSLVIDILYKYFYSIKRDPRVVPGEFTSIHGLEYIKNMYCIDHSPIGRMATSTPATYIGIFDRIRQLFAQTVSAKRLGLDEEGYFSYNSAGRCPECRGIGFITSPIQFLGNIQCICPACDGKRYNRDVQKVKFKDKSIVDILRMNVDEACDFFYDEEFIFNKLSLLKGLGMGYIQLGQHTNTISGGEGQRIRLANELGKLKSKKNNLYIMDEPTTGLHIEDIQKLINCIQLLVDKGHSVIVIEHNTLLISQADYIIDMGPGGGRFGGRVIAAGTPEEVKKNANSITGKFIK